MGIIREPMSPLRKTALFAALTCALIAPAHAQTNTQNSSISVSAGTITKSAISDIVRVNVLALGRSYQLTLRRIKGYSAKIALRDGVASAASDSKPILFQGDRSRRSYERRSAGAAAHIINETLTVIFPDRTGKTLVSISAPTNNLKLAKVSIAVTHRSCGLQAAHTAGLAPAIIDQPLSNSGPIYSPTRFIEISTDADFEYCRRFGSAANAHIQAVLNSVEAIYTRQMGLAFDIIAQNVFCKPNGPYTSSNSDILLTQFQAYTNRHRHLGKADTYHLFSGKNLDQNIIGLSYVGAACASNGAYSYGLSQRVPLALEPILTAHELGHILGASHDPSYGSIMSPYLSNIDTGFTSQSLGEMASYIDQGGQCLTTVKALRLKLKVKAQIRKDGTNTSLSATLTPTNQTSDCNLYLFGSAKRSVLEKPDLFASSATLVSSQSSQTGNLLLSASIASKPRRNLARSTYLRGVITCPDGRWAQSEIGSFKGSTSVSALAKAAIR